MIIKSELTGKEYKTKSNNKGDIKTAIEQCKVDDEEFTNNIPTNDDASDIEKDKEECRECIKKFNEAIALREDTRRQITAALNSIRTHAKEIDDAVEKARNEKYAVLYEYRKRYGEPFVENENENENNDKDASVAQEQKEEQPQNDDDIKLYPNTPTKLFVESVNSMNAGDALKLLNLLLEEIGFNELWG